MKKGISTILAVSITVIVMLVLAVGGWYYMDKSAKDAKKTSDDRIATLEAQVTKLQKDAAPTTTPSTSATDSAAATTDTTAGWKTYTNTNYGFSFRYPSNYSKSDLSTYSTNDGAFIADSSNPDEHLLSVEAEASNMTLSAYLAKSAADAVFNSATSITLAGQPAYEGVDAGMINSYGILVKKGANVYHITLSSGNADSLAASKTALTATQNQMLSSFQFTN